MFKIEYCYSDGDLASALAQSAEFVEAIGERYVTHVVVRLDGRAWWVDVIYQTEEAA